MDNFISVVICTYNRAPLLKDCLDSFLNQTASQDLFEVIVVNNNSSDNTISIVNEYCAKYPNFKLVTESAQGLSRARNRGYKEAKSEWIAYIDDDARALPQYIERLNWAISNYEFDCIGGPCIPLYHQTKPKWYKDEYQNSKRHDGIQELNKNQFISGFNSIFRKSILEKFNGFDATIGMNGKKIAYGEETQIQVLLRNNNGKIWFDSELIVYHFIDSYKLNLLWFFKSPYSNGRDSWVTFQEKVTAWRIFKLIPWTALYLLKVAPKNFLLFLTKKDYYFENLIVDTLSIPTSNLGRFVSGIKLLFVPMKK